MTAPALPAPRTDAWQLVERAQQGDRDAMAEIYRANYDAVFGFVLSRVWHRPTAEDLTADVFLRALTYIHSIQWRGSDIGAWLVTVARNRIYDYLKSARYRYELPGGNMRDGDEDHAVPDPDGSAEDVVVDDLLRVRLREVMWPAMAKLTAEQRQVIALRFFEEMSVAATARAMGKEIGAIKALQYRATQRLSRDERVRALVAA